jgi:aspartate kinase
VLYVLKFGGSSVATVQRIENVASIIKSAYKEGHQLIVVVSAMYGITNQLLDLAKNFTNTNYCREMDVVLSSGEQIAAGLLTLCLQKAGIQAKSFLGWQIPIITNSAYGEADIKNIANDLLKNSKVVSVIAGFQGVTKEKDITTIGRGGSDATAVAIANVVEADECFIYTDVDGVYTADPRTVLSAKKLDCVSYEEMMELSLFGAKVLQHKSVKMAKDHNVKLRVLSSFSSNNTGTTVKHTTFRKTTGIAHDISSFLVKTEQQKKLINNLKQRHIDFIKLNDLQLIINKTHFGNVKNITQNLGIKTSSDSNVGIVTAVGLGIKIPIMKEIHIKFQCKSNRSASIIVPLQQTEMAINTLHELLF